MASGWTAVYSIAVWTVSFVGAPIHDDVRLFYVAAEAGLRYGWSTIYDQAVLRELSSTFPEAARSINTTTTFASTPLLAWLFAPLTALPEPVAYALWALLSLAALVFAWHIAAPYTGLPKYTLLLLGIGLWPVMLTLYFGQPTLIVLALVAASWWLCVKNQSLAAGAVLAIAMFVKPQAVVLVPAALLVSGRYRVVAGWAAGSAMLAIITVISLGSSGLVGWWHAVKGIQGLPINTVYTLAQPLGMGALTYLLWGIQGLTALAVAWKRRREPEIVFAVGILGTVMTATYYHNSDYCVLLLAAWLVLRTSPPMWHRLFLLAGIVPMQLLLTNFFAGPQLVWDAGWLAILAFTSFQNRLGEPQLGRDRDRGLDGASDRAA